MSLITQIIHGGGIEMSLKDIQTLKYQLNFLQNDKF